MKYKKTITTLIAIPFIIYTIFFIHNNFWTSSFTQKDIDTAYKKSILWINHHQDEVLNEHNPMLWWMLIESLRIEDNPDLRHIINEYQRKNYQRYVHSPWYYLVYSTVSPVNAFEILDSTLPDYNKYFVYGFSCNKQLEDSEIIRNQEEVGYCFTHHPISPACLTHQLMGFRFLERTSCDTGFDVKSRIDNISDKIVYQLMFDMRIVDVYIQRVLMLVDSGHKSKVNNRWIARIIEGQLDDGGWGGFQPLFLIGKNKFLGFSTFGLSIQSPRSSFHTTAQGILLMTMLKNDPSN